MISFKIVCSSVFLFLALITQGYAGEHFPFLGEVSKDSVNVRAGANTNFEKIDQLSRGAEVVVVGKVYEWYKVQLRSTVKAYIRADYLRVDNESKTAQLIGDKVNARALPNSDSSSLGQLIKGVEVRLVALLNGWWCIEPLAGVAGWVHQDFIVLKSSKVDMPRTPQSVAVKSTPVEEPPEPEKQLAMVVVQGVVNPLVNPLSPKVHYQLVAPGGKAYYLQDIPDLHRFSGSMVDVEGIVGDDKPMGPSHPLIDIRKIVMVL